MSLHSGLTCIASSRIRHTFRPHSSLVLGFFRWLRIELSLFALFHFALKKLLHFVLKLATFGVKMFVHLTSKVNFLCLVHRLLSLSAQRKAGRRQRGRRAADLVFKMAGRVLADEYAIFKISSALFLLRILNKSLPIYVVCMKRKLFSPHTLDPSIIMFTTELHNNYNRIFNRKTTSRGRDSTAFNFNETAARQGNSRSGKLVS